MRYTARFDNIAEEFLALPKRLYGKGELTQSESDERALIGGRHVLSSHFAFTPLIVCDEGGSCAGRCAVTVYPDDSTAYIGFFECVNDPDAAEAIFSAAEDLARRSGAQRLIGPVDASFWIKYRMKADSFGKPYTGEPYNLPYYRELWEGCGYRVFERYTSNHFPAARGEVSAEKFSKRLSDKLAEGYSIESVTKGGFDRALRDVYKLLIELYSSFPVYKRISEEEFAAIYGYFGSVIRRRMVKLAYCKGKPVGFFVSIPNYGNVVYGKLSLTDYIRIFLTRSKPREYVMLYMGVDPAHRGLGKALAMSVHKELAREGASSIGALIRSGGGTKDYFFEYADSESEYLLFEKPL